MKKSLLIAMLGLAGVVSVAQAAPLTTTVQATGIIGASCSFGTATPGLITQNFAAATPTLVADGTNGSTPSSVVINYNGSMPVSVTGPSSFDAGSPTVTATITPTIAVSSTGTASWTVSGQVASATTPSTAGSDTIKVYNKMSIPTGQSFTAGTYTLTNTLSCGA